MQLNIIIFFSIFVPLFISSLSQFFDDVRVIDISSLCTRRYFRLIFYVILNSQAKDP